MASVDDLFRKPLTTHKRKFEEPDAQAAYKATKISETSSPHHANGNEEDDSDMEAGPSIPPEDDDDGGDDEDGRFFGTGITGTSAQALDYIDEQDGEGELYTEEKIDAAWLRRLATSFDKKVAKNAALRAKHASDPEKFMESEAQLDAEIKSWSLLTDHPELYVAFAESGSVERLVGLLAHENTDIAIAAVEIVSELLDEDVETEQEQWDALVQALLEADLLDLLMSNLGRLDENIESDRSGVYHTLSVMENLGGQQSVAETIGTEKVLDWLCNRARVPEQPIGQNKQSAAEVLQVLLQSSPLLRRRLAVDVDGVDLFLRLLAPYRKRSVEKDSSEEEYVENLFDALTCVVDETDGKNKFVEAEGVELMLIMLKESTKNMSQRALRVLDHATNGQNTAPAAVCDKIVDAAGLKTLFSIFNKAKDSASIEHLLGIFSGLLRLLPGESAVRIRTLAKFTEKGYEKVAKLVQLRRDYVRRVAAVDKEIKLEQKTLADDEIEEREAEWFSRRLEGGSFCLQMIDVVLAWLVAEDREIKEKLLGLLDEDGLSPIKTSIEEQIKGLEAGTEEDQDTMEMLETLSGFLS